MLLRRILTLLLMLLPLLVTGARSTAVVIGSGFGGLALAIRLQAAGIQTTILERRDRPGGRAYVYEQDGFTFDGGPTIITALKRTVNKLSDEEKAKLTVVAITLGVLLVTTERFANLLSQSR